MLEIDKQPVGIYPTWHRLLMQSADHSNFKTVSKLTVEHMKLPNEFNEALQGKKET